MLTKNQLKTLRNDVVLNSLFLKDYSNNLYIKNDNVYAFFDGYMEYLNELAKNDAFSGDVIDIIAKYDNINNLYNYYLMFDSDPLLQNDFIASKPINNSDSVVIYNVVNGLNDYVLSSIIYLSGYSSKNTKIVLNMIHRDSQGNAYIIKYNNRYYLNDFMRA